MSDLAAHLIETRDTDENCPVASKCTLWVEERSLIQSNSFRKRVFNRLSELSYEKSPAAIKTDGRQTDIVEHSKLYVSTADRQTVVCDFFSHGRSAPRSDTQMTNSDFSWSKEDERKSVDIRTRTTTTFSLTNKTDTDFRSVRHKT
jgi:hypothetical protein